MGGFARIADDDIKLMLGRIQIDLSIGGTEPMTGWYVASTTTRDGGETWSDLSPEIRLFPEWTELYGASNPHRLSDGRLLWAVMGTRGRDLGWHAGVSVSDPAGEHIEPPTIIAEADGRDYSDIDVIRLDDGRFLAVVREHQTRQSVWSHSSDEGRTWSPIRADAVPRLEHQALPASLGRDRLRVPRRGPGAARREPERQRGRRRDLDVRRPAVRGRPRRAPPARQRVRLPRRGASSARATSRVVLHAYPTAIDGTQLHWLRLRDRT